MATFGSFATVAIDLDLRQEFGFEFEKLVDGTENWRRRVQFRSLDTCNSRTQMG